MSSLTRITLPLFAFLSASTLAFAGNASIEANLTGVDARALKTAQIRVESLDKKSKAVVVKPDSHGHAMVANLEQGQYRVTAIVDGKTQSSQKVKAGANKTATVALKVAAASTASAAVPAGAKTKVVGTKRYVWVPGQIGSRFGGYWKEVGGTGKPQETGADNVSDIGAAGAEDLQRQQRGMHPSAPGGR